MVHERAFLGFGFCVSDNEQVGDSPTTTIITSSSSSGGEIWKFLNNPSAHRTPRVCSFFRKTDQKVVKSDAVQRILNTESRKRSHVRVGGFFLLELVGIVDSEFLKTVGQNLRNRKNLILNLNPIFSK